MSPGEQDRSDTQESCPSIHKISRFGAEARISHCLLGQDILLSLSFLGYKHGDESTPQGCGEIKDSSTIIVEAQVNSFGLCVYYR